ncbi:hypothetical protein D9M72_288030 [compost metagenome]
MAEPVFDIVGHLLRRAHDHAVAAASRQLSDQRAHRQVLALRHRHGGAEEGVVAVGRQRQVIWQRRIQAQPFHRNAQCAGQPHQAVVPRNQVDQLVAALPRLRLGGADDGGQPRQHLDRVRAAPQRFGTRVDLALVGQRFLERLRRGEHRLGMPCGQLAPVAGAAGLEQHRMALRRPRQVQRALHVEEGAMVRHRLQPGGIDKAPVVLVADQGIVFPAVPQRLDEIRELVGTRIALSVVRRRGAAEVACRAGIRRGHHVPARAAATDMVQRGKAPRDVIGLVVAGGGRGHQSDMGSRRGDAGQQQGRLQRRDRPEMDLVGDRRIVGQEDRVELPRFSDACQADIVLHVHERTRVAGGQAPRRRHEAGMERVDVQVQLPLR